MKVVGSTGLGSGTGKPFTAKWLDPDHSTDGVTVDVDIADFYTFRNSFYRGLDATVDTKSKAIASIVDIIDYPIDV